MNEYIAKYLKDKINETGINLQKRIKKDRYRVPALNENIQPERSYCQRPSLLLFAMFSELSRQFSTQQ